MRFIRLLATVTIVKIATSIDALNGGFFTSFDPPFPPALTHPGNMLPLP
jgi:hypothetical protein